MAEIFRETLFGHFVRVISRNHIFQYPEERQGFQLPRSYTQPDALPTSSIITQSPPVRATSLSGDVEKVVKGSPADLESDYNDTHSPKEEPLAILPTKSKDGTILVDWYTTDNPANPQNWSSMKKAFVALQIWYEDSAAQQIKSY